LLMILSVISLPFLLVIGKSRVKRSGTAVQAAAIE
jgi:hypothetical protein